MADDVPLAFYLPAGLFLKPEARVWIEVKLPEIKDSGKSISNWEVMEKIKALSMPVEFVCLRVSNYSRELIQFEGELDSVRNVRKIVLLLHGKSMKLSGFSELLKLKAKQVASSQPTKAEWEEYFQSRGVSSFDDGRPGERADTLKISGLPVKWFTSKTSSGRPCHKVLAQAFQKFGTISQVGFYDPTAAAALGRKEEKFSSFGPGARQFYFEAYVQYEKYAGFNNAMGALKGMSLLRLEEGGKEAIARITADFDKTAFLSERNIRKRRRAEERRREEMEEKRRFEEEKRRAEERKRQVNGGKFSEPNNMRRNTQNYRVVLSKILQNSVTFTHDRKQLWYVCKTVVLFSKEEERRREEEAAKRRAEREERRRKKREQRVAVVTELKTVAVQRRGEAQRLLRTLLAGAAEER